MAALERQRRRQRHRDRRLPRLLLLLGSGSYWRTDAPADGIHVDIYFVQGSASESGTASDSGSCTTTSQLGSTGWTTTGSGSTSSSSTKSYSYSGAGTLTVAPANTNYSNAYGSMTDVRQNVADENGSGSITEKHAMGWSLASGATQWSGTDTGDLSSATSTATYGYGAFERYSFASGPASQSSAGSSWQTWSDRQTLSSGVGSISGSAYGPASTWNWQSGNGQAMENFASYECNYWMTGVDADANNYQLGNTKDSWSMPGSGASNTVQGSQWSDSWSTDDYGNSYQSYGFQLFLWSGRVGGGRHVGRAGGAAQRRLLLFQGRGWGERLDNAVLCCRYHACHRHRRRPHQHGHGRFRHRPGRRRRHFAHQPRLARACDAHARAQHPGPRLQRAGSVDEDHHAGLRRTRA